MLSHTAIWNDVNNIRKNSPLVHNITNFVVMNNTANALLAIGASPVMAHAQNEVEDMVNIASSLVINIGTLSDHWVKAMDIAMTTASNMSKPIVFDPVGAGATNYRTEVCLNLLKKNKPTVIRGNASEIMSLINSNIQTKGVDSSSEVSTAKNSADLLAKEYECVVVVSGEVDYITNGEQRIEVANGNPMMPKVTGLGCTATALCGAFVAVNNDIINASANAMAIMGICGEIAAKKSNGPATLQLEIINAFYNLTEKDIEDNLR